MGITLHLYQEPARRSVLDARAFRGADAKSDQPLVITKVILRPCKSGKKVNMLKKYNMANFKVPVIAQKL